MKTLLLTAALALAAASSAQAAPAKLFPANGAQAVNPDAVLKLTFSSPPKIGKSGKIRIYETGTDKLIDTLDMAIPAGPTERSTAPQAPYISTPYPYDGPHHTNVDTKPGTPSAGAAPTDGARYQLTIIGGFTDGFHFYPITVDANTATIHPHNNLLQYGKSYYVQIDPGVLAADGFNGVSGKAWRFVTKAHAPKAGTRDVTVSADGKGDFNTVQGAIDWTPDHAKSRITIHIRNGLYQEIVYFRNKDNLTFQGQDADKTLVRYANNEVLNPHPVNIATNEWPGTYPSRRAAFDSDHSNGIHVIDMTVETSAPGQSEGLLMTGEHNILKNVNIIGGGDAAQLNGTVYIDGGSVDGTGDTILGRGATYFDHTVLRSTRVFMWIRNTEANHGNVFNHCTFIGTDGPTDLVRSPGNNTRTYPYAEAVFLHSTLINITPEGFGEVDHGGKVRLWEFDSRDKEGRPVDVTRRVRDSRQLDAVKDAKIIADYSNPTFVLGGWNPKLDEER